MTFELEQHEDRSADNDSDMGAFYEAIRRAAERLRDLGYAPPEAMTAPREAQQPPEAPNHGG